MASVWVAPASGDLLNNGQPWRRGDTASVSFEINTNDLDRIELIGGVLPPGLFYNGGTKKVQGTITALPKDTPIYPTVFRVYLKTSSRTYDRSFRWIVDTSDEEQHWNTTTGIQYLGSVNRGSSVTIRLDIVNPDQDPLVYKAVGYVGPQGSFQGLPNGLTIDEFGRVVGSPTITGNNSGDYYFKVYARDPDDLKRNPRGEGSPRTSEKIYRLTIAPQIVLDARLSDVVRWETPAGSLGSCYETYPSHFAVKASPQYQVSQGNSSETQMIRYTLTPQSKPLPNGLILDQFSGLITGRCPYVTVSKSFEFTVEARVVFQNNDTGEIRLSSIASERTFSITVKSIFTQDAVTSLQINVPGPARQKIAQWIWGNKAEAREDWIEVISFFTGNGTQTQFLAPQNPAAKSTDQFSVLVNDVLVTGTWSKVVLNSRDYIEFQTAPASGATVKIIRFVNQSGAVGADKLTILGHDNLFREADTYFGKKREYRILLLSGLNYLPDGTFLDHLKDYHHPTDLRIGKLSSARARSPEGTHLYDVIFLTIIDPLEGAGGFNSLGQEEILNRYVQGQPQTAIPQWNLTKEDFHYYPASIKNLRLDLINRTNRLPGQSGYGLSGKEGLPLWMISEQEAGKPNSVLGYVAAIELACVKPGSGPAIVKLLEQAGLNDDLQGTSITVDRYLLLSDGTVSTTFDGPDWGTDDLTTFDGPDNVDTTTTQLTTFDTSLQSESKYYKFPPGDR